MRKAERFRMTGGRGGSESRDAPLTTAMFSAVSTYAAVGIDESPPRESSVPRRLREAIMHSVGSGRRCLQENPGRIKPKQCMADDACVNRFH
ncbi:MAG: hypothetical protein DWQ34_10165 [Planctomycetota bacterium]|nr:MAG: hypothetical protein DWQ34_10165 [Planctomycetota bacterium]REK19953.1 MAG: hypothetical protein DWQ41_26875 [Planctomycetota bacterium]REK27519.1 MAG: hypothetical protein DWQ45_25895 [Planctomycetota bacterium]